MPLADQFASAIDCAQFHQLNDLSSKLWKAHAADQITAEEAHAPSLAIHAKRPKIPAREVTAFRRARATVPKPRTPAKQAAIERRRRLACATPVPPEHRHLFTQGQHAAIRIIVDEVL